MKLRRLKTGLLTFALALVSTFALGQTATTFIYTKNVGARTNALAPFTLDAATVAARFREADAALNNKQWEWAANAEQMRLGLLDDTGVLGGSAFLIDRTGTTVDTVGFGGRLYAISNGTISLPAYGFGNDGDTGMYLNAVGDLRIAVGGADKIIFAASGVLTPNIQLQFPTNPLITNVQPILWMFETGVTAENGVWLQQANGEQLRFQMSNDALNSQANWLTVDRTANLADTISLFATTTAINGASTYSGNATFAANILSSSAGPTTRWNETDAAANNRLWDVFVNAEQLQWRLVDDAISSGVAFLTINRTGNTVDSVAVSGSAFTYNGSNLVAENSSPTWTGTHTWSQNMTLSKADPRFCTYDSGSDATFFWRMSSDVLRLNIVDGSTCTTTGASAPFAITSAAGTVSAIGITSTALTWNGLDMVNTGSAPTWTGQHVFSSSSGAINLNSVNPALQWTETDQGVDGKLWNLIASAGSLQFQTRTDAGGAGAVPLSMARTGTAVDSIGLAATAVNVTGKLNTTATATGAAGLNLPHGTAPSSPVNGDLWTTTGGLFMRQNGTTRNYLDTSQAQTVTGSKTFSAKQTFDSGGVSSQDGMFRGGRQSLSTQSPTSLSANTNDWSLNSHPIVFIAASAAVNITGIAASAATTDPGSLGGTFVMNLINKSSSKLTLTHEDANSTAANRFKLPYSAPYTLGPNESVAIYYDNTDTRWLVRTGKQVSVQENFSGNLAFNTGCTATFNLPYEAAKIGNQVTIRFTNPGGSCTGNSTAFQSGASQVPAALTPDVTTCWALRGVNNGTAIIANTCFHSTGAVSSQVCISPGVANINSCAPAGWTASGTRVIYGENNTFTYNVDISGTPTGGGS